MSKYDTNSIDLREIIDRSLSDLVNDIPVDVTFIEKLGEFFSTTNAYLFGSREYENKFGIFLNIDNHKDSFYELITVFYSCLVIRGLDYVDFKNLSTWILDIKKNLPGDINIKQREGLSKLMDKDQPDLYKLCLYLLHINFNKFYTLLYSKLESGNIK